MTTVDKSASDKAHPTGEAKAAKLIAWFNAGAGGRIQWGKPGDFAQCVLIAGKHMTPDQAKGFCALRHRDATGARPGQAPAERAVHKAGRLALLRRLLSSHPAATTTCPSCGGKVSAFGGSCPACGATVAGTGVAKALPGGRTFDEMRSLVADALRQQYPTDRGIGTGDCYVRDMSDDIVFFQLGDGYANPGLYRATYVVDPVTDDVVFGTPVEVEARTGYVPKDETTAKALGMSTAAMVAFYPSPGVASALALPGGELPEDLHITLAYLGNDAVVRIQRETVEAALAPFAAVSAPVDGVVAGLGRFNAGYPAGQEPWPLVALIDCPTLPEFRQRLVATLEAAGLDVADQHGFQPHLTMAYVQPQDEPVAAQVLAEGIDTIPLSFGSIVLAWGDERLEFFLDGTPQPSPDTGPDVVKAKAGPVIKADESKRYTFAPLYPASPETPTAAHLDAHGDFATADDLQKAVWDYMRAGDRSIRDQHRNGTTIGECVEIVSWPYQVTVPMTSAAGATVQKSFAPGTVFLGVVWNEAGWSDVVKGVKTGYSLGGLATRVAVEMA